MDNILDKIFAPLIKWKAAKQDGVQYHSTGPDVDFLQVVMNRLKVADIYFDLCKQVAKCVPIYKVCQENYAKIFGSDNRSAHFHEDVRQRISSICLL